MADVTGSSTYAGSISFTQPSFVLGAANGTQINGGFNFDLPLATVAAFTNNAYQFAAANSANNRGFVSGVIDRTQSAVTDTSNQSLGFLSSTISALSAMNTTNQMNLSYRANVNKPQKAGGGCFITTAICAARELPDDCEELQILREFRDTYMLASCRGRNAVRRYYEIAPQIAGRLSYEQCESLRVRYLAPAITFISVGDFANAEQIYSLMVAEAARITGV